MTTSTRKRNRKATSAEDTPKFEVEVDYEEVASPVSETVEAAETVVDQDEEIIKLQGPFVVEGTGVVDGNGRRVTICGYDHNRSHSGPVIAEAVAVALNRLYRTTPPVPRDES